MDLQGKTVVVVGLALTGVAVAKFCVARGANVIITDKNAAETLSEQIQLLEGTRVTYELGGHDERVLT